jgi:hypothetical protein
MITSDQPGEVREIGHAEKSTEPAGVAADVGTAEHTGGVVDDAVRLLVVDAANVVGSRPDGWWRDRAGAARRLLAGLAVLREQLPESRELVVVLEGAAKAVQDNEFQDIRIVRAPGSGDDAIVAVTAESDTPEHTLVVTADRGLRARVEALGARTAGPRWLLDRIDSIRSR